MTGLLARAPLRPHTLPMAAIASAGICLGIWFAREQWGLCLALVACLAIVSLPIEATFGVYLFLLPFDPITRLGTSPDGRTLSFYVGGLSTVAILGIGLLRDRLRPPPRMAWYWLAFVTWSGLTTFWALDQNTVLKEFPTVLGLLGLYVVAVCFQITKQQLSRITFLAIAGGFAASLFSISNFFAGVTTVEARASLIFGTQQADPNLFAAALMVPLALAVGEFAREKSVFENAMLLVTATTISFAILVTMSRGAVLGLLAMAAVYLWQSGMKLQLLLITSSVGCSIAGLSMLALPSLFLVRFKNALATGGAGRLDIWIAGLKALKHFFLQGAGIGNFEVAYQQYAGFAPTFRGYSRVAHNIYLEIAVELGIVGIALFLCAVLAHLRRLYRPRSFFWRNPDPTAIACSAMIAGMLVSAFFVGMLWQKSFWITWILSAFAIQKFHQRTPDSTQS